MSSRFGSLALILACAACAPVGGDLTPAGDELNQGGSGGTATGSTPFPCDVGTVLASKCWSCHGDETQFGAPMRLTSWESVHATYGEENTPVYQRVQARIHDTASPMPPLNNPRLSAEEKAILDAWVAQGAPPGNGCAPPGGGQGGSSVGGSGTGGSYYNTGGASTGTGGSNIPSILPDGGAPVWSEENVPVEPAPEECDYIEFRARQDASNAKFSVPTGEQYYCFGFQMDLEPGAQGLAFYPEVDNTAVIHHWLLYKTDGAQVDGSKNSCIGAHPDGQLIAGWAPGAGPVFMPQHVGLTLGGGSFMLEVHYYNSGPQTQDNSGVRVCKAKQQRPKSAGISWLGTEAIFLIAPGAHQVPSTCTPNITEPIHVLLSWPHMHKYGRRMTATIRRANGATEPLFDVPFDFNYQYQYPTPAILNPGDSIETVCHFETNGYVVFGQGTNDEMCYNFVTAYPEGALVSAGLLHSNSCSM
jgi:hypothetical protein